MAKQTELNLNKGKWGGRRTGCGRKRIHSKGVAHRKREKVSFKTPLHINLKVKVSIRNKICLTILKKAIKNSRSMGLVISHFSLQSNHIHLIVEASDNKTLTQGMRSFTITFAKNINRGRIQLERYHLHVLKTLMEVKNAVHYVLFNEQKHRKLKVAYVDQYSSLYLIKDLKRLAKIIKVTIILKDRGENFLDSPQGWMMRNYCLTASFR